MRTPPLNGSLTIGLRLCLGAIFIYAGVIKAQNPQAFADSINDFDLLPSRLINLVALSLPPLEIMVGAMLLVGWQKRGAAFSAALLLCVFTLALVQAAFRGLNVDCGCFGTTPSEARNIWSFAVRDLVLLSTAIAVYTKMLSGERDKPSN